MQNNTVHSTDTGFSHRSQGILFAVVIILGLMIVAGVGVMTYMGLNRYFHGRSASTNVSKTFDDPSKKSAEESTYGSVLMVPRQGLEVVHSAVSMPSGKLAVVMFPGFSSGSAGKEVTKKDPNNTADGGRILIWDPETGHITQEMRITSVRPQIHP